eukprot:8186561-Ditylum_brightwellii.AAC.1
MAKRCNELKTAFKKASFNTIAGVYGMILGRDFLKSLGIILNHATEIFMWDDASIPMKTTSAQASNSFYIKDPKGINDM